MDILFEEALKYLDKKLLGSRHGRVRFSWEKLWNEKTKTTNSFGVLLLGAKKSP